MPLFTTRYYRSATGEVGTWAFGGQSRDDAPADVEPVDYARRMLDYLVSVLPGDDGVRVRVWIGEAATDAEAEVDLSHPWTEDTEARVEDIARCRDEVANAEALARSLETQAKAARGRLQEARAALAASVYVGTISGVPQTRIVGASGHARNWVRTTVRDVESQRIAALPADTWAGPPAGSREWTSIPDPDELDAMIRAGRKTYDPADLLPGREAAVTHPRTAD
ncbi:hypothetical protein OG594_46760 [Streptomyces sp. NBC_01214]|uniref:hypothetical protein n=1 Tax=Streptomyces sp. NBC_01214 TaxID=2903777 RepID=UPI002250768E|nr:hypothetical protein [Streptomyces sp. NBC_01214]MCX4808958.1 hypothetical protein [Streptomyces sp. NBC_01214]